MLYGLSVRHRSDALSGAAAGRKAQRVKEDSSRVDRGCSIVEMCCARKKGGGVGSVGASGIWVDIISKPEADRGLEISEPSLLKPASRYASPPIGGATWSS
jgi:hypothetical protein